MERTRRIDTNSSWKSDGVVVPETQPNREIHISTEAVVGRTPAKRSAGEEANTRRQSRHSWCRSDSKACEHEPKLIRHAVLPPCCTISHQSYCVKAFMS